MQRTRVISSNIKSVGYDAATEALEVEFFSGKVFRYAEVPANKHAELMAAESVGKYFNASIKGIHDSEQVEP